MTQPVILSHFIMTAQFSKEIVKFLYIIPSIVRTGWITRMFHLMYLSKKRSLFE